MIERSHTCHVVALLVCIVVAGVGLASPAAALQQEDTNETSVDSPETPEEYLQTFREMEGSSAYGNYSEFELVRSQAVQDVQVGEFTDAKEERMEHVYLLLVSFERAYASQTNGSHDEALEHAHRTRELTEQLRSIEGGEPYALSAELALDRFYEQTGQELLNDAEQATTTPDRITLLNQSSVAYDRAGAADRFAEIEARLSRLEQNFASDRERMEEQDDRMSTFLDSCTECGSVVGVLSSHNVGVFSKYPRSLSAERASGEAISIAAQHGLDEEQSSLEERQATVQSYRQNLALVAGSFVLTFSLVVGLLAAVVTWRLMLWRRDLVEAERGDVVLMGEMLDA